MDWEEAIERSDEPGYADGRKLRLAIRELRYWQAYAKLLESRIYP